MLDKYNIIKERRLVVIKKRHFSGKVSGLLDGETRIKPGTRKGCMKKCVWETVRSIGAMALVFFLWTPAGCEGAAAPVSSVEKRLERIESQLDKLLKSGAPQQSQTLLESPLNAVSASVESVETHASYLWSHSFFQDLFGKHLDVVVGASSKNLGPFMAKILQTVLLLLVGVTVAFFGIRRVRQWFAAGSTSEEFPRFIPAAIFAFCVIIGFGVATSIGNLWFPKQTSAFLDHPVVIWTLSKTALLMTLVGVASGLIWAGRFAIYRFTRRVSSSSEKRLTSLVTVLRNIWSVIILIPTGLMVLSGFGVNVTPIIASISVVSLGVGLATQHVFKDLIAGLFIILEDSFALGDSVALDSKKGTIEEMTLRTVRIRGEDGAVHTIPFGSISQIANMSRDYAWITLSAELSHGADLDQFKALVEKIFQSLTEEEFWKSRILGGIDLAGVSEITSSGLHYQFRLKAIPENHRALKREFLKRLLETGYLPPCQENYIRILEAPHVIVSPSV